MTLEDAIRIVGTIDNASGQICQMKDGKPDLLLFEFGCPSCSEVASKNADEYGDALVAIVNAAPGLVENLDALCNGLEWMIENHPTIMNEADNEALAAARIALKWATQGPVPNTAAHRTEAT